ncbi:MAG TPA: metalloregulator ArsR/SmtB family transcription factor [Pseudomonadales bacterium]|nr:metalloregulator ArsR/SmtB family transcription factor [Pseudomonadales bacterium]
MQVPSGFTAASLDDMRQRAGDVADFLKTLANQQRLLILCALLEGELCVGDINERVDLSPSALSQHLSWLREAGMVITRRQSQTIFYRIADNRVLQVMGLLKTLFCQ